MEEVIKIVFWDEDREDLVLSTPEHEWSYHPDWMGEAWLFIGKPLQKGENKYMRVKRIRMTEIETMVVEFPIVEKPVEGDTDKLEDA